MDGLIPIYAYGYHIHMLSQDGLHEKAVLYHKKFHAILERAGTFPAGSLKAYLKGWQI